MIISSLNHQVSTYLENTNYYYYSFNYEFYNGYKTLFVIYFNYIYIYIYN